MMNLFSVLGVGTLARRLLGVRLGRLYQYPPKPMSISFLPRTDDIDNLPSISLVTPSFNQANFVKQSLESVVSQNYLNLEYVVQDAKSSDGTEAVLKEYAAKGVDIYIEADHGQADALNRGFARTTGEIMGYLNSDDLLLPGTLHFVARYFRDNPSVDVIYGNRLIVNEDGYEVGRWILPGHNSQVLSFIDYVPQESMFWRRRVWNRVGSSFDANLNFALDWDLILRFLKSEAIFHHIPNLFGIFRIHSNQKSQADFAASGAKEISKLRSRYFCDRMNRFQLIRLHGSYLMMHRKADAAFRAGLFKLETD